MQKLFIKAQNFGIQQKYFLKFNSHFALSNRLLSSNSAPDLSKVSEQKNRAVNTPPKITYDVISPSPVQRLFAVIRHKDPNISKLMLSKESQTLLNSSHNQLIKDSNQSLFSIFPSAHQLFHLYNAFTSDLSVDGYQPENNPPHPFGPRMQASGIVRYVSDIHYGQLTKQSTRAKTIKIKQGSKGPLVFVTIEMHTKCAETDKTLVLEDRNFVYKLLRPSTQRQTRIVSDFKSDANRYDQVWSKKHHPLAFNQNLNVDTVNWEMTPIQLFRYSALTFNAHRIHWDVAYTKKVEAYKDLVVHGPLTMTLMLYHFRSTLPSDSKIVYVNHRATAPLFVNEFFSTNVGHLVSSSKAQEATVQKAKESGIDSASKLDYYELWALALDKPENETNTLVMFATVGVKHNDAQGKKI